MTKTEKSLKKTHQENSKYVNPFAKAKGFFLFYSIDSIFSVPSFLIVLILS